MKKQLKRITATAMFAAMIFVFTMFVKIPVASGYVHLGDALVYLCAMLLGEPWALLAAAIGEGAADIAGGYAMYAPATLVIKCFVTVPFCVAKKGSGARLLTLRSGLMTLPAAVITVGGYYIADLMIDRTYAVIDIPGNLLQALGSAVVFLVLAAALDKADIKRKINF